MNLTIRYENARGEQSIREVTGAVASDSYIQGFCLNTEEVRTFRRDRIIEILQGKISELPIFKEPNWNCFGGPKEPRGKQVCATEIAFTGFEKADKLRLRNIAEGAGMVIRNSVTRYLDLLCCGDSAGPAKVKKAHEIGALVLSELQLQSLIETGEIPEFEGEYK